METLSNYIIVLTAIGALMIGFGSFLYSIAYDIIFENIIIGIKKFSKNRVIIGIIFSIIALIYISIVFEFIYNKNMVKSDSSSYTNFYSNASFKLFIVIVILMLMCVFIFKLKIKNIINNEKIWCNITITICTGLIILSGLDIWFSSTGIYNGFVHYNTVYKVGLYKKSKFIGNVFLKDKPVYKINDNFLIKLNGLSITNGNGISNNTNGNDIFSLVSNGKRIFIFNKNDYDLIENGNIEIVKGDKISLDVNGKEIGFFLFDNPNNSSGIGFIIEMVVAILFFYSVLLFSIGIMVILLELTALKRVCISLDKGRKIYGKILYKDDDFFYMIYNNKFSYIAKNEVEGIESV